MRSVRRLTLVLAAAGALAAPPALAGSCKTAHDGACAANGAACGPRSEPGQCATWRHRTRHAVQVSCECRVKTPHGFVVIP
ncbi:MAG TPA: hypothetical protein VKQ70_17680 [Caulobacteraceae bacterium]|jgi:hypothetical protein|nr:hypothetical protein [Caulobacteraceae bacterium]